MKDFVRRGRSNSGSGPAPSIRSVKPTRMSILPSVKFPSLRRQDPNDPPPNNKQPLLTLSLSSRSFLDSSVQDATTHEDFYKFKTVGTSTTISRIDAKQVFHKTISIKWPRALPTKSGKDYTDGVLIQMKNARWYGGETLLKLGAHPNASRKFSIPNYSHPMKWKRYGQTYWCTTASVRGPVATLDATKGPEPLKLTIYETLHDKYDPDALAGFKGVSILLLDYLLLTAMLLVTDLQEWMLVRKAEGGSLDLADTSGQGPSFAPDVPFRSDPKFRKIMYGEPIYSKVANGQRSRRSSSPSPVRARSRSRSRPRTPATPESGMPTFVYPESEASSPGPSRMATLLPSMTDSDDEDDEDDDYDTFSLPDPHRASALAESFHFLPITPTTHNSAEPNYYGDRPPVPPLPLQYAKSFVGRNFSSQPPTPVSGSFVQSCEPPLPPLHHIADLISRPRSSPPFQTVDTTDSTDNGSSIMHGGSTSHHDDTTSHSHSHSHSHSLSRNYPEALEHPRAPSMGRAESIRSYTSTTSRTGAAAKRPLPRPPPVPSVSISAPPVARRVQSSSQLANYPSFPKDTPQQPQLPQQQTRPQRSLPPTPGFDASLAAQPSSPVPSSSSSSQNRDPDYTAANTSSSSNTSTSTSTYLRVTTSHTLMPPGSESSNNNSLLHSRQPPITKASQEDLASYVHLLTVSSPQRDLPPEPLPNTSIFDVPPPAYNTIVFSKNNAAGSAGAAAASEVGAETDSGIDTQGEMDTGVDIGAEAEASGHVHYAHTHGLSQGQELYQHYQQYHSQQPQPIQYQYSRRPTLPDIYDSAVSNSP